MTDAVGRLGAVVVDCHDPASLAAFWAAVVGGEAVVRDTKWATVRLPCTGVVIDFQQVPEPKAGKNRLHLDVTVSDLAAATTACVALGAEAIGEVVCDEVGSFQVMVDPEGNEFCLVS
ncbi:MAG TPA: VOC family protein [Acidimicrobiales bacterium]|nr:VOC family protein [Acidimicrobiales bacterium]